jgi:sec-independent protein translocase protein TatA
LARRAAFTIPANARTTPSVLCISSQKPPAELVSDLPQAEFRPRGDNSQIRIRSLSFANCRNLPPPIESNNAENPAPERAMFEGLFQPMHLLVILILCLIIFGPKKLPELGRGLGEGIRGFRDGMKDSPRTDSEGKS